LFYYYVYHYFTLLPRLRSITSLSSLLRHAAAMLRYYFAADITLSLDIFRDVIMMPDITTPLFFIHAECYAYYTYCCAMPL